MVDLQKNIKQKKADFQVPSNYFVHLKEAIECDLFENKLRQNSREAGFQTPQHYFDDLSPKIKNRILKGQQRRIFSKVMQYAAACVLIACGISLYYYHYSSTKPHNEYATTTTNSKRGSAINSYPERQALANQLATQKRSARLVNQNNNTKRNNPLMMNCINDELTDLDEQTFFKQINNHTTITTTDQLEEVMVDHLDEQDITQLLSI